jgi:hypothetical protein
MQASAVIFEKELWGKREKASYWENEVVKS